MGRIVTAAGAFLFTTLAAGAADWNSLSLRPTVAPQSGFSIGLIGGYNTGKARFDVPDWNAWAEDKPSGWDGGVIAGYEFHENGYFSAFEIAGMIGGVSRTHTLSPVTVTYGIKGHVDARIRAGIVTGDGIALSAIGGVSYNNVAYDATDGVDSVSGSDWQWGWIVGAGIDMPVTDRISIGGEYTYNKLVDRTYGEFITVGGGYHAARLTTRLKI